MISQRRNAYSTVIGFAALIAVGFADSAASAQSVNIGEPSNDTSFPPTVSQIGAAGSAGSGQNFVLYCGTQSDGSGTVWSSVGVTAMQNGIWSADLPAPMGGWPPGTPLYIYAKQNGNLVSNVVQIYINE